MSSRRRPAVYQQLVMRRKANRHEDDQPEKDDGKADAHGAPKIDCDAWSPAPLRHEGPAVLSTVVHAEWSEMPILPVIPLCIVDFYL